MTASLSGFENYEYLWDDSIFWLSVFNTLLYTSVASIIKFAVGLYLALLLNERLPFKAIIRAVVLIPFIVPTVLSAIAFWWLFDPQFSIISWSLKKMGLITANIDFLGDVWNARWSVIFANIWRGVPFVAITLLAGLQTVSPSLYEAATIDGATTWQTLPLHHLSAADADHRGGDDVLGAVHLHRLPADLGDDARRPGQRDASDGDVLLSARDHERLSRRRSRDLDRDDPVPARAQFWSRGSACSAGNGNRAKAMTDALAGKAATPKAVLTGSAPLADESEGMSYLQSCRAGSSRSICRSRSFCSCCCSRSIGWR